MGALGINLPGLLAQVVNFLILLALLYLFVYKPLLRIMDQRSRKIKESLEEAERVKEASAKAQENMQQQLDVARQEGQRLLEQAREMAERYREEEREKAQKEVEAFLQRARQEIQAERDAALEEVRHNFADLAVLAAERVIERSLDRDAHRGLIEKVLEESSRLGRN